MNLLIRKARITDPHSPYAQKVCDIYIKNGKIEAIGKIPETPAGTKECSSGNLHVSPGWLDMQAHLGEPGFEYKEDVETALQAAALGGFTAVAAMPNSLPVCDTKQGVEYLRKCAPKNPVEIIPVGALSKNLQGQDMAELYDMFEAGAPAFCDDKNTANAGLLMRAMLYAKPFGALVMNFPFSRDIAGKGNVNEGSACTLLGLKGIPAIAEEVIVNRDLYLAEYCQAPIHFMQLTSYRSFQLLKQAKAKGAPVSCGVSSYHLFLSDDHLQTFDTNFKTMPPLKSSQEMKALLKAVKEGIADVLVSDHTPENIENKKCEFELAAYGIINLQTSFALAHTALGNELSPMQFVNMLSIRPRQLMQQPVPLIKEGESANLTLFDPSESWTLKAEHIVSKSKNTPFIGQRFTGRVIGIYNNGRFTENVI